jgi:hypothetical protein
MGGWDTGAFDSDTAEEFLETVKRARKPLRPAKLREAIDEYLAFDERLQQGSNIVTLSPQDIAEWRRSREMAIEWNKDKLDFVFKSFPHYATEETFAEWLEEQSRPRVEDGIDEALRAFAAGTLLAAALDLVPALSQARCLRDCPRAELVIHAPAASACLQAIPGNTLFRASWSAEQWDDWESRLAALATILRGAA